MRHLIITICCLSLGLLSACQNGEKAAVVVEIPAGFAAENLVQRIVLQVTAPDITTLTETLTPPFGNALLYNLQVPIGVERVFTVTAVLSTGPRTGFVGRSVGDIDQGSNTIPITMNFVNFAEDLPNDGINGNPIDNPELMDVSFYRDNLDTLCAFEDAVFIEVRLDASYNNFPIGPRFIIEFDTDADPTTGSQTSFIMQTLALGGAGLATAFSQGTERFLLIDADGRSVNGILRLELYEIFADDSTLPLLIGPQRPLFDADYDASVQILRVCLAESLFNDATAGIDDDGFGTFNVLTGYLSGTGQFFPNDMAFTAGAIKYDFLFDTSGL